MLRLQAIFIAVAAFRTLSEPMVEKKVFYQETTEFHYPCIAEHICYVDELRMLRFLSL